MKSKIVWVMLSKRNEEVNAIDEVVDVGGSCTDEIEGRCDMVAWLALSRPGLMTTTLLPCEMKDGHSAFVLVDILDVLSSQTSSAESVDIVGARRCDGQSQMVVVMSMSLLLAALTLRSCRLEPSQ